MSATVPHILVVGGTKGIGRAVARRLAGDDQIVSVIGRSQTARDSDQRIKSWAADVSDLPQLKATLAEIVRTRGPLSGAVLLQRYRGGGDDWAGEIGTSLTATRELIEWAGEQFQDLGRGKATQVSMTSGVNTSPRSSQ